MYEVRNNQVFCTTCESKFIPGTIQQYEKGRVCDTVLTFESPGR